MEEKKQQSELNNESSKELEKNKKEILYIIIITSIFVFFSLGPFLVIYFLASGNIAAASKPIIYLYPTNEMKVSVKLGLPDKLSCTYPNYSSSWEVMAKPNGDLQDLKSGRNLYSLYWEGINNLSKEIYEGFCIKGEDSSKFLEEKLEILGLSDREANEFIIYWLPRLEEHKYNLISFETMEEINDNMPLEITPKPDSIIRVMMRFKGVDSHIDLSEQKLQTPQRTGFVVVEWGGTELK